ncbi:MAG: alpha/beta fold hydrolase [Actinomycetota bacterium]
MSFADLPGARVCYEDAGSGPTVVFSHGILMDHEMFAPQVGELRGSYRCITWDERGHGATTSEGSFTYWDLAGDLVGLLDHLGVDKAVSVGMSQGGFLSLRAALKWPERISGLAFIDSQAGPEDPEKVAVYQAMVEAWVQEPTRALADATADVILGSADREPWIRKWLAYPPEAIVEPFGCLVGREDLHELLGEITCPALVIHGTEDVAISMDKAEALCAGLPGRKGVVRIEGGSHACNLTHPDEVNAALRDFLNSYATPAS